MSKFFLRSISILPLAMILANFASAEAWEAVFPDAKVLQKEVIENANYPLALGPLKNVNSRWQPEREKRVRGDLQRRTMETSGRFSVDEIYRQLRIALQRRNARPLYTCSGLDCGSSNAWANNYFGVKQLYGLDQNQYFGAWEMQSSDGALYYMSTYVVQRGNQRIYVQIDQIQVPESARGSIAATPSTLIEALQQQGYFILAGVDGSGDKITIEGEHLQAVAAALQRDPWLKIRVVGHDYGVGDLAQQQQRSRQAAERVRELLLKSDIEPDRISAHGVGSLAPALRSGSARIEVVRQ
jgi:outer membrane protein OmpA-like peptidoglycan-associated protein